jgi:hypothetical protein
MLGTKQRLLRALAYTVLGTVTLIAVTACDSPFGHTPSPTATPAPPYDTKTTLQATWDQDGSSVTLYRLTSNIANVQGITFTPVGNVSSIQVPPGETSYQCLATLGFTVYSAPDFLKDYYIVTAYCADNSFSSWVFKQIPTPLGVSKITWQGQTYMLTPLTAKQQKLLPKVNQGDRQFISNADQLTVDTNIPQCLNSLHPGVWVAPNEFPWPHDKGANGNDQATYIVEAICPDSTRQAWTFIADAPPPIPFVYSGRWHGQLVDLTLVTSQPANTRTQTVTADADKVTLVYTDNIKYRCITPDQLLNTYVLIDETSGQPTGKYYAVGHCITDPTGATLGDWIFTPPPSLTPSPTPAH